MGAQNSAIPENLIIRVNFDQPRRPKGSELTNDFCTKNVDKPIYEVINQTGRNQYAEEQELEGWQEEGG